MSNIKICLLYVFIALLSYLISSISPGILLSRYIANIDIREHGSKSTGATNVLRVLGAKAGLTIFVLDALKAILSCFISQFIMSHFTDNTMYAGLIAGLFSVIGHNWPIYHGFCGGKGVACSIGIIIYLFPYYAIISIIACIIIIAITKFVSLGSMSMMIVFTILLSISHKDSIAIIFSIILTIICIYRHKANIYRLVNGKENKLNLKFRKKG